MTVSKGKSTNPKPDINYEAILGIIVGALIGFIVGYMIA